MHCAMHGNILYQKQQMDRKEVKGMKKTLEKPERQNKADKVVLYAGESCAVGGGCSGSGINCAIGNNCGVGSGC